MARVKVHQGELTEKLEEANKKLSELEADKNIWVIEHIKKHSQSLNATSLSLDDQISALAVLMSDDHLPPGFSHITTVANAATYIKGLQ